MPEGDKLKISWDDIRKPQVDAELKRQSLAQPQSAAPAPSPGGKAYPPPRQYGSITPMATQAAGGGLLYSAVFYTALAGLLGALLAWIISELIVQHALTQDTSISPSLKAAVFFATIGAILGLALCAVEGIVSRNYSAAAISGMIGIALGMIGGGLAGGLGQTIYSGWGGEAPQNIVVLADTSGSMTGRPLRELKDSARTFVQASGGQRVLFGIVSFGTESTILSPLTDSNTSIVAAIDRLETSGGTNMLDGLRDAGSLLLDKQGKNAILLFTDGSPTTKPDIIDKCVRRKGMTEEEWLLLMYKYLSLPRSERAFGSESGVEQMDSDQKATATEKKLAEAVLRDALDQTCQQTISEAGRCRAMGIRVVAVGTGEADRAFLEKLTGNSANVLFADPGTLSSAFMQAQRILFQEERTSLSVKGVLTRTLCWAIAGMVLASGQGIAMRSGKKTRNVVIGGFIGGLIGGVLFDPLSIALQSGWASRLVAIGIIGISTGAMIGLVENMLKDAWLQVLSGPLTGKQFVIYRNPTTVGSSPKCDIYLFKDPAIEPQHAAITSDGRAYVVQDTGSPAGTFVNGRRIVGCRLKSGDRIQIGGTTFLYSEKVAQRTGVATA